MEFEPKQTKPCVWRGGPWEELKLTDKEIIELLKLLANGCSIHPSYRAKHKVVTYCETCNRMWDARQKLKKHGVL